MKIIELIHQPNIAVTNEELELLDQLRDLDSLSKKELTERQQYIIDNLVKKDLVIRRKQDGSIIYKISPRI